MTHRLLRSPSCRHRLPLTLALSALLLIAAALPGCGARLSEEATDHRSAMERVTEDPTNPRLNYEFAKLLIATGEHEEAIARLEFNLTLNPGHRPSQALLIEEYLSQEMTESAIGLAVQLRERKISLPTTLRGLLFDHGSQWLASRDSFRGQRAVDAWMSFADWLDASPSAEAGQRARIASFRLALASFKMEGGYLREALHLTESAALADPELALIAAAASYLLGETSNGDGYTELALNLAKDDPARQAALLTKLRDQLAKAYRFDEALAWTARLIEAQGETREELQQLASLSLDTGAYDEAERLYLRYFEDSSVAADWVKATRQFIRAGEKERARRLLKAGFVRFPSSFPLAVSLLEVEGREQTGTVLSKWLEHVGATPDSLARIAGYFRKHHRGKGCSDFFRDHAVDDRGNTFALGQCALAEGHVDEAIAIFERGLQDARVRCRMVDAISDFLGEHVSDADHKLAFLEKHYKRGCGGKGVVVRLFNLYTAHDRTADAERVVTTWLRANRYPQEVVIEFAESFSSRKLFEQGIRILETAIALHDTMPARAWYLLGSYLDLEHREVSHVFDTFNRYVEESEDKREALRQVEEVYRSSDRLRPGLIGVYHRLSAVDPDDTELMLKLGRFALATSDRDGAVEQFTRFIATKGYSEASLKTVLSELRDEVSRDEDAVLRALLDAVGRASGADQEAHRLLGRLEAQVGRQDRAYYHFRRSLETGLRAGGLTLEDGDHMTSMGFHDLALIAYEHIHSGQSTKGGEETDIVLLRKIAEAYLALDNLSKARAVFTEIRRFVESAGEPKEEAEKQIAFLLFKASYFAEAITPLRRVLDEDLADGHEHIFDILAQSLIYSGRQQEILEIAEDYVEKAHDEKDRVEGDAWLLATMTAVGRLAQVEDHTNVIKLLTPLFEARRASGSELPKELIEQMGRSRLSLGDVKGAVRSFERLIKLENDPKAAYAIGRLLLEHDEAAAGRVFLEKGGADKGTAFRSALLWGEVMLRRGEWDEAAKAFETGLKGADKTGTVLMYLLGLYQDSPRLADFPKLIERSLPALTAPGGDRVAAYLAMASAHFRLGDQGAALAAIKELVDGDREASARAGMLLETFEMDHEAAALFEQALDYPHLEEYTHVVRARLFDLHYRGDRAALDGLAKRILERAADGATMADFLAQVLLDLEVPALALDYAERALALSATEDRQLFVAKVLFLSEGGSGEKGRAQEALLKYFHFPVHGGNAAPRPDDQRGLLRLTQILSFLLSEGAYDEAVAMLDALEERVVEAAPLHRMKAGLYLYDGRREKAVREAVAYFSLEDRDAENQGLFALLTYHGLLPQLEVALRERLKDARERETVRRIGVLLVRTLLAREMNEEAESFAQKLLVDEAIDRPGLFFRLGLHAWYEGQLDLAERYLMSALKARDPDVAREAGFVLIKTALLNEDASSRRTARETEELLMRRIKPPEKALEDLAGFFFLSQDFKRAEDYLQRSLLVKAERKKFFLALEMALYRGQPERFKAATRALTERLGLPEHSLRGVSDWLRRFYAPKERAWLRGEINRIAPHGYITRQRGAEDEILFGDAARGHAILNKIIRENPQSKTAIHASTILERAKLPSDADSIAVLRTRMVTARQRRDTDALAAVVSTLLAREDLAPADVTEMGNQALHALRFPFDEGMAVAERLRKVDDPALAGLVESVLKATTKASDHRESFERYLKRDYRVAWSRWVVGRAHLLYGDISEGVARMREAFAMGQKPREMKANTIHFLVDALEAADLDGIAEEQRARLARFGIGLCDEMLKQEPLDVWRVTMKAELLFLGGDAPGAIIVYEKALALLPMDASLHNNFAYLLARSGLRLPEALQHARRATRLDPSQNRFYKDTIGWVLFKMGRGEQALKQVRASLQQIETRNQTSFAEVLYHLGAIYRAAGREKEAREAFRRASYFDPAGAYGRRSQRELDK